MMKTIDVNESKVCDKDINNLNKAFEIASIAHSGQKDKTGKEYINHPIAVSKMCNTIETKIVGLLHDVVEDTNVTIDYLKQFFSREIIEAIDLLTKREPLDIKEYYRKIKENKIAKEVKLADLSHNMDLSRFEEGKITQWDLIRNEKYKKFYAYLIGKTDEIVM